MFKKLIAGLGTYKSEFLEFKEYLAVLQSVGLADIIKEKDTISRILQSLPANQEGKVSYKEFVEVYNYTVNGRSSKRGGKGISTRRFLNSYEERIAAIVEVLPQRPTINLGSLLSGCDPDGNKMLKRDQFYRVIDSLSSKLCEGDIIELINYYDPMGRDEIDIV